MPTKIELLRQAGFSTEQIADWAYKERLRMRAEGVDDNDIDRDFGVTRPAEAAQAPFLQRLKTGAVPQRMIDAAKEHWDRSVGEHPLDSALDNWGFLQRFGLPGKMAATAATELELASKGISGVLGGLGAAAGQGLEEALGPGNRPKGTAARDAALMAEMVPVVSAAMAPARAASIAAPLRTAGAKFGQAFPKATEFQAAAASISGNQHGSEIEQQLLQLWKEFGVHPLDVAGELSQHPAIAEAIKSHSAGLASRTMAESRAAPLPAASVPVSEARRAAALGSSSRTDRAIASKAGSDAPVAFDSAGAPDLESNTERVSVDKTAASRGNPSHDVEAARTAHAITDNAMVDIRDPPMVEQRPFHLDYPKTQTDGSLALPKDIEGRELHARFIAGRRTWAGPDEGLGAKEINEIIRELAIRVKIMELPEGTAGRFVKFGVDLDNPFRHLHLSSQLTARERELTKAHELGHALDDFLDSASSKLVPNSKEMDQLRIVYGKARKGDPTVWFTRQPETYKYTQEQVSKELFADGFRVYLRHPNFFKTVAPDAARMIRALVNDHPVLSKIIQFNSIAGAGLLGDKPDQDDGKL